MILGEKREKMGVRIGMERLGVIMVIGGKREVMKEGVVVWIMLRGEEKRVVYGNEGIDFGEDGKYVGGEVVWGDMWGFDEVYEWDEEYVEIG